MSGGRASNMKATDCAATLHKRKNSMLVRKATTLRHIGFVADESLIDFDDCSRSAHGRKIARTHCFADAMTQKPCGF
jgi:hypothetical protein